MRPMRLALVGDFSPDVIAHRAINETLRYAAAARHIDSRWVHTSEIRVGDSTALHSFDAVWCVPNSPYANTAGALWAIEWARTRALPFLGTCGGFQHALMEFALHVLGWDTAAHAELEPNAPSPLISPLACSLVEKGERVQPAGQGRFSQWYGVARTEGYCCSYGLNPAFEDALEKGGMQVVARGESGAVRAMELSGHPFFIGTLFQPERAALRGELHPLIAAFVGAPIT